MIEKFTDYCIIRKTHSQGRDWYDVWYAKPAEYLYTTETDETYVGRSYKLEGSGGARELSDKYLAAVRTPDVIVS